MLGWLTVNEQNDQNNGSRHNSQGIEGLAFNPIRIIGRG